MIRAVICCFLFYLNAVETIGKELIVKAEDLEENESLLSFFLFAYIDIIRAVLWLTVSFWFVCCGNDRKWIRCQGRRLQREWVTFKIFYICLHRHYPRRAVIFCFLLAYMLWNVWKGREWVTFKVFSTSLHRHDPCSGVICCLFGIISILWEH